MLNTITFTVDKLERQRDEAMTVLRELTLRGGAEDEHLAQLWAMKAEELKGLNEGLDTFAELITTKYVPIVGEGVDVLGRFRPFEHRWWRLGHRN